jgi:hypothetical protein
MEGRAVIPDGRSHEEFDRDRKAFEDHLDKCEQCENHPFAMCPIGITKLRVAALGASPAVDRSRSIP